MTKEQFKLFLKKESHDLWQKEDSCIKQECNCGWGKSMKTAYITKSLIVNAPNVKLFH